MVRVGKALGSALRRGHTRVRRASAPGGLQSRTLAHRHQPRRGHGHTRAFNTPHSPLADRVNGRVEEALPDFWDVPGRSHNKTRKDPEAPRDHVIGVAHSLRAHPHGFARHTTAPDDAPQDLQRV